MGVYYYFHNDTQKIDNKKNICGRGIYWYANFHLCCSDKASFFKWLIKNNKWNDSDKISAIPDYDDYPYYVYKNGLVKEYDYIEKQNEKCPESEEENEERQEEPDDHPDPDNNDHPEPVRYEESDTGRVLEEDIEERSEKEDLEDNSYCVDPESKNNTFKFVNIKVDETKSKKQYEENDNIQQLAYLGSILITSTKNLNDAMTTLLVAMKKQLKINNALLHVINELVSEN